MPNVPIEAEFNYFLKTHWHSTMQALDETNIYFIFRHLSYEFVSFVNEKKKIIIIKT